MTGLPARMLVVTDLDGTLLDTFTYRFDEAGEALAALFAAGGSLVIATSKTRAEVEPIAAAIGGSPILIVENGGEIVMPITTGAGADAGAGASDRTSSHAPRVLALGTPRPRLVQALADIARETATDLRGFAQLSPAEIAAITGLSEEQARLASARAYDEPFLIDRPEQLPAIADAARRRRLRVTRGGRLHHLTGETDKGDALRLVLATLADEGPVPSTIGLGDAANDLPFLRIVDRPIVIPGPDGRLDAALAEALPHAERAPHPGPVGWNVAILDLLAGRALPRVHSEP